MARFLGLLSLVVSWSVPSYALHSQIPLKAPEASLIYELERAEIIPTVIDTFKPFLTVSVAWDKAKTELGNTIKPKKLQQAPNIFLTDELPDIASPWDEDNGIPQLTLAVTDPDAPSRDNPEWSQFCHWIITNVPLTSATAGLEPLEDVEEIMPYKPPGPPPKTGKHRYVFIALAPKNGTTDKLFLSMPKGRKRWGYEGERQGLREWAEENGLGVVGANFIYSQNKKQ